MTGRVVKPISQPLIFKSSTNDSRPSAVLSKQRRVELLLDAGRRAPGGQMFGFCVENGAPFGFWFGFLGAIVVTS